MNETPNNIILIGGFVMSVVANIGLAAKFFLERKTNAEVNAYNQLSQLFVTMQQKVEKQDLRDKEAEKEFSELEEKYDTLCEKVRKVRFDLMDLREYVQDIRKFMKTHNIADDELLKTLNDFEEQLSQVGECLR